MVGVGGVGGVGVEVVAIVVVGEIVVGEVGVGVGVGEWYRDAGAFLEASRMVVIIWSAVTSCIGVHL